jgi:hypothetical protein
LRTASLAGLRHLAGDTCESEQKRYSYGLTIPFLRYRVPRQKNEVEAESIRVSLTPGILDYLSDLVQTGLFGRTAAAAAERLIELGIKAEINQGTIARRPGALHAGLSARQPALVDSPEMADSPSSKRVG